MAYHDALAFLLGMRRFGLRPGLDTTLELAASVGNPHRSLRFVHVAGTNGKGSTCAFLESILRQAGLKVGLYTSPHLVSFRERIQVQRVPIPEAEVARLVDGLRTGLPDANAESHPTFFEFVTVLALQWFEEQKCDVVVWETGLGGRLDATNIVQPEASVITNIGWDHMQWLGPTLPDIAREKAGIIKSGLPVLTATDVPEALEVIRETARRFSSPLQVVDQQSIQDLGVDRVALPLAGAHQRLNAALAAASAQTVLPQLLLSAKARSFAPSSVAGAIDEATVIRTGLETTEWDGRFQRFEREGRTVIVDGAHNRPALECLAAAIREWGRGRRPALVLGMLADKDLESAPELLGPWVDRVMVVPVDSTRGSDPVSVANCWKARFPERNIEVAGGLVDAMGRLKDEPTVLVTGSLYLVGECLSWLRGESNSERALNEWSQRR
ncbi:MAG: bifunctional folylpolyglutamate synthase/dihydrofolate synthase [Verrucomicrobiales bacterium]|nr:bifunctional folylpolyglutamate synthase/dihydrofolate synthase [Verrucomicrobiales bacterium]